MNKFTRKWAGPGFSYVDIDAHPDDPVYQQVLYPYNSNNILSLCTLTHYLPDGDDDMGAICGFGDWDWTKRERTYVARTYDSDRGFARFRAVLIDLDMYPMVDGLYFVIKNDSTYIKYLDQEYDIPNPAVFNLDNFDPDTVPIVAVMEYTPNGDDDFNYSIQFEAYNQFTFNGFNGNDGSHTIGYVYILKPNYSNTQNFDISVTWTELTGINGQENSKLTPLNYHDRENRMIIPSLVKYFPGDDNDFWAYGLGNLWTLPERVFIESGGGDPGSSAGYLFSILTNWP